MGFNIDISDNVTLAGNQVYSNTAKFGSHKRLPIQANTATINRIPIQYVGHGSKSSKVLVDVVDTAHFPNLA